MLRVWRRRSSFNLQKVMWLVGEMGLPHDHIPAGGDFGLNETPRISGNESARSRARDRRRRRRGVGISDNPSLSRSPVRSGVLDRRSGGTITGRAVDGLVAVDATAGFSDGRVLGFLSNSGAATEPACASPPRSEPALDTSDCLIECSTTVHFFAVRP
jgi:hypothetical protein